jgi:hypothetical protein
MQNTSFTNLPTAQASNQATLKLHRDGRLSYKDDGHWTRYDNEIPGELWSRVPPPQRRRLLLLRDKRAFGRNSGSKLVVVRIVSTRG